jgi:hypothetical protein
VLGHKPPGPTPVAVDPALTEPGCCRRSPAQSAPRRPRRDHAISWPNLAGSGRFWPDMAGFSLGRFQRCRRPNPVSGFERFCECFSGHCAWNSLCFDSSMRVKIYWRVLGLCCWFGRAWAVVTGCVASVMVPTMLALFCLCRALVSRLLVLRYSCRLLVWHALFACSFALLVVAQQCRGPTLRLRRLRPHGMRSFPRSIAPSMK